MSHESLETMDVGLAADLKAALRRNGWSTEEVKRACAGDFLGRVRSVLLGFAEIKPVECPILKLVVNCNQSLADMIAAGNYDWANNDITADHFPIEGTGQQEVEAELSHFNRKMTSEQVLAEMDKAGSRPAKIEELLALGAQHPDLQKQFPIPALGSPWRHPDDGRHYVPCLHRCGSERGLNLYWFGGDWREFYRFLAVRK